MTERRFLRDNIMDELLQEVWIASEKIAQLPTPIQENMFTSLIELYESNIVVLRRIEKAIEQLRENEPQNEIINTLAESAAFIQLALKGVNHAIHSGDYKETIEPNASENSP